MADPLFNMGTKVATTQEARAKLTKEIELSLGGGMIDLELEPAHYALAIDKACDRFRTRSTNAYEESFVFLEVQPDQSQYKLHNEVMEVKRVFRRGLGQAAGNSGASMDPFSSALIANLYMVPSTGTADLATYDFAMQHRELVGRMFGEHLIYTWDSQSKNITFHRMFTGNETIMLWVYNYRPDNVLLTDVYTRQWLRSWAIAECKMMLGEVRELYGQLPGPQGGTTLNGAQLKAEAQQEFDRLDEDAWLQRDGGKEGYGFVIG